MNLKSSSGGVIATGLTLFTLVAASGLMMGQAHGQSQPVDSQSSAEQEIGQELETYASFDANTPPGNIAIGPDGRKFLSVHGFYGQAVKMVELFNDGSVKPYPTAAWASSPDENQIGLYNVLGVDVDKNGVLWMLDTSDEEHAGRLVGWNTRTESLEQIIYIAKPMIRASSFLNDLAIDNKNGKIYLADTAGNGQAAIVVVDIKTGQTRRVLEGSKFTQAENVDMTIEGRVITLSGKPVRLGVNPITIAPDSKWLYFGSMSGTSIYRVLTDDITDNTLDMAALEDNIERYGDKSLSDGMTIDGAGNMYVTSVTQGAIEVTDSSGDSRTLYKDQRIVWPDGFANGTDGYIYFTVNELHRSPVLNGGVNASKGEFKVMRFPVLAEGKADR
ncbi:L-dopachrome tautomerase-related protein [uncultured Paraglaciecola sp.]|uniref:L-dopachrome tautomerase-related protein n=1 Tax=uncultured Paraglaciecola sp. TaxID=1765024 RepID=UPI0030DD1E31|tara:strand:+ start:283 stop:1446 length:1164 start_codon:yes stop_codon:yes gene_type:complete